MRIVSEVLERLRSLLMRDREARELAEEIRFHIDRETEKNIREGMSAREARRTAHLAFGGVERWTDEWRAARGVGRLERWARDLRLAARRLAREPSLSLPALLTLTLGVGASTAVFALVHTVLLAPLPYPDAGRLVEIGHTTPLAGLERVGLSPGTYARYREGSRTFEDVALYHENAVSVSVTDGDVPERVRVAMVTPSFFTVMGVRPALGRAFRPDEGRSDGVVPVILSHELWVRRYGADPTVVNGTIELNRTARVVVGVMPPGFDFPHADTEVWYASVATPWGPELPRDLIASGVARLRPGVGPEAAEADLTRLLETLEGSPELQAGGIRPAVSPLRARMVEDVRAPLRLLGVTAGFVLLVTLANVSGLFLVRAERRRRELQVARALGAGRSDVARRFLAEGLLLSGSGGALGTAAAWAGLSARFGFAPSELPRLHELAMDGPVAAAAVALTLLGAFVIAGVSLLRSSRFGGGASGFGASSRTVGGREWQRVHRGLAAFQVALSMALLVGSTVMVESLVRLARIEPGFEPGGTLTFHVNPPASRYLEYGTAAALHRELRERLLAIPGVRGVEVAARLPLAGTGSHSFQDHVEPVGVSAPAEAPPAWFNLVSPGYFELMGIPVISGLPFGDAAAPSEAPPVVLSARLAEVLFEGQDPVGRRLVLPGYERFVDMPAYTVAGVVGDVPGASLTEAFEPTLYFPAILAAGVDPEVTGAYPLVPRELTVLVRAGTAPLELVAAVRETVRGLDSKLPVTDVRTLDDVLAGASAKMRLVTVLLVVAALAALGLGVTGVYGIVAYSVSRRTAELGVRLALGATSEQVQGLVLGQTAAVAAAGLGGGILAAFWLNRALAGQLYEVSPTDPGAFAIAGGLLLAVVLLAGWMPARSAGRLDAVAALRAD